MAGKCCVPGCVSVKPEVTLHSFPRSEKRFQLWCKVVNSPLLRELSKSEIVHRRRVCRKHFEAKYIRKDGERKKGSRFVLTPDAFPTLFSKQEIESGVQHYYDFGNNIYLPDYLQDHTYVLPSRLENQIESVPVSESPQLCSTTIDKEPDPRVLSDLKSTPSSSSAMEIEAIDAVENDGPFSWNKRYETLVDAEIDLEDTHTELEENCDELMCHDFKNHRDGKINETEFKAEKADRLDIHEDFVCNLCNNLIVGFRYVCVQCADHDVCAACEARGAHAMHYVLRVPGPRPHGEVQSMLAAMRRELFHTNVHLRPTDVSNNDDDLDSVKLENVTEDPFQNIAWDTELEARADTSQEKDVQPLHTVPTSLQLVGKDSSEYDIQTRQSQMENEDPQKKEQSSISETSGFKLKDLLESNTELTSPIIKVTSEPSRFSFHSQSENVTGNEPRKARLEDNIDNFITEKTSPKIKVTSEPSIYPFHSKSENVIGPKALKGRWRSDVDNSITELVPKESKVVLTRIPLHQILTLKYPDEV